jgi:hypothetical protein
MKLMYYGFEASQKVAIDIQSIAMLFSYQDFKLTMSILNSLQPPNKEAPATTKGTSTAVVAKAPTQAVVAAVNKSEIVRRCYRDCADFVDVFQVSLHTIHSY